MKRKLLLVFLIIATIISAQQNQIPVVGNVHFSQRIDGSFMVDIYYDVSDYDGNSTLVTMEVSDDGGATWDFSATKVIGDVGHQVENGTNKHIVWDFGAEHPNTLSDNVRIKILADDGITGTSFNPCPGMPTVVYAGKTYNTVQIFDQCWLKENLDVGAMTTSEQMIDDGLFQKFCYDNEPTNCDTYGGLYNWNEAMNYSEEGGAQGICPPGWRIPTIGEYIDGVIYSDGNYHGDIWILTDTVNAVYGNANALKEVGQGSGAGTGTNTSGFSLLMAGKTGFPHSGLDVFTYLWGSDTNSPTYFRLDGTSEYAQLFYGGTGDIGQSVRCIKTAGTSGSNIPPNMPFDQIPVDGAADVLIVPTLGWSHNDPDADNLFFDIYLGTNPNPEKVKSDYFNDSYTPLNLIENTTYYWKVTAKDGQGETEGPVWSFTTKSISGGGESCSGIASVTHQGKTYNTVQIGSQCWLRENLNLGTRIDGVSDQSNNGTIEKYCYNDDETNCDTYGGLYQWEEAMQYLTADAAQGICPEGWHIPTGHEFKVLEQFSNDEAKKLLAIGESDDANNETGFSALFAGRRGDVNGTFSEIDELTYFYSSSKSSLSSYKYNLKLDKFSSGITINAKIETNGLSVRCIKGENANTYSEPCPEIPTLTYQGKTYNTVQIGEQCWLKENLNVGTRIPSSTAQSNNGAVEKYCYDNDETNCDIYGGLYQWNEAMEYASQEGAQGICPTGWHIPTRNELGSLMSAVFLDGNALKAVGQGSGEGVGIDARGFSALLTGQYWYDNNFAWLGDKTYFWSSSEMSTDAARYIIVNGDDNKIISTSMPKNLSGISIRCLKD